MTTKILTALYNNLANSVSGQSLSDTLNISRVAVKKHIDKLILLGYPISAMIGSGYVLQYLPDIFDKYSLGMFLAINGLSLPFFFFKELESTNKQAKEYTSTFEEGVVVSSMQSKGIGRIGRKFHSQTDGVYLTYFCRPPHIPPTEILKLVLSSVVGVHKALKSLSVDTQIKWTNDLLLSGKKVCGILCQTLCQSESIDFIFEGIGINVNNQSFATELEDIATSLKLSTNREFLRAEVTARTIAFVRCENNNLFNNNFSKTLEYYKNNCITLGKEVTVHSDKEQYKGTAVAITDEGYLVVRTNNKERKIMYGDVSVKIMIDEIVMVEYEIVMVDEIVMIDGSIMMEYEIVMIDEIIMVEL